MLELLKKLIDLYNEYGHEFVTLFNSVSDLFEIEDRNARTHCEHRDERGVRCGRECDQKWIKIGDKKISRGDCPIHGFER